MHHKRKIACEAKTKRSILDEGTTQRGCALLSTICISCLHTLDGDIVHVPTSWTHGSGLITIITTVNEATYLECITKAWTHWADLGSPSCIGSGTKTGWRVKRTVAVELPSSTGVPSSLPESQFA